MLQKNNEFKIKSVDLKKYVKTTHYKCGVFLPKWDNKKGYWRYRVDKFRIICKIEEDKLIILIVKIAKRDVIYED